MYQNISNWSNWTGFFNITSYKDFALGGLIGGLIVFGIIMLILFLCALYIYNALAWVAIAKKMKYKHPWLAWIPFAASAMKLQMGGFSWAWVFLFLIPILGWIPLLVLLTISIWRIFGKLKYPAWLSLFYPLSFIPKLGFIGLVVYLVSIGIIAWKKR